MDDPLVQLRALGGGLSLVRFTPDVADRLSRFTRSFQLRAPITYAAIMTDTAFEVLAMLSNAALLKREATIHPLFLRGFIKCLDMLIEELGLEAGDD
jgi:hypothetical protein